MLDVDLDTIPGLREFYKEPLDSDIYRAWRRSEYTQGRLSKDPSGTYRHQGTRYHQGELANAIPLILASRVT